jgi:ESS family glutamate:Na+ symporter
MLPPPAPEAVLVPDFISYTLGILAYFAGVDLTRRFAILRSYNIPEPVTGGLVASLLLGVIYLVLDREIGFELATRDRLLVYFFTCIGLNARLGDLIKGGRKLLILLALTLVFIVLQSATGVVAALGLGLSSGVGVLLGSASLIGGHGTAIAWAPEIAESQGVANAMEIGVAAATLGLVVASLVGGPIASRLMAKFQLTGPDGGDHVVGIARQEGGGDSINHLNVMAALLAIHIAILAGWCLNEGFVRAGLKLPLFVSCLLAAIVLSNTIPSVLPKVRWPARTPALAVVSEYALSLFLTLSLMSLQLWTLVDLAGPLLLVLSLQTLIAVAFIRFILFPAMGRDYEAAVLSAGFGGFALGATPTAIANMTAVTKAHGSAPNAFIILPLVSAFFVDLTNAGVIQGILSLFPA